jgi:hypothetical protein
MVQIMSKATIHSSRHYFKVLQGFGQKWYWYITFYLSTRQYIIHRRAFISHVRRGVKGVPSEKFSK